MRVFQYDANVIGIANAEAGANGRSQRHDGSAADVFQSFCRDLIVSDVRQHNKTFLHKSLGRFKSCRYIWKERFIITDNFELYQFTDPGLARETAGANGIIRGVTAGCVG